MYFYSQHAQGVSILLRELYTSRVSAASRLTILMNLFARLLAGLTRAVNDLVTVTITVDRTMRMGTCFTDTGISHWVCDKADTPALRMLGIS